MLRASISFQSSRGGQASIPAESRAKALNASTSGPRAFLRRRPTEAPCFLKARNQAMKDPSCKENLGATFPCFRDWSLSCRPRIRRVCPRRKSMAHLTCLGRCTQCFRGHSVAVADFVSGTIKNRPKTGHDPRIHSPCLRRWEAHGLLVSAGAGILRSAPRKQCTVGELKVNYGDSASD